MTTELSEIRQAVRTNPRQHPPCKVRPALHQSRGKAEAGKDRCGNGQKQSYAVCRACGQSVSGKRPRCTDASGNGYADSRCLEHLKSGMHRSAEAMRDSAGRIDAMREELHEVGRHLKTPAAPCSENPSEKRKSSMSTRGRLPYCAALWRGQAANLPIWSREPAN